MSSNGFNEQRAEAFAERMMGVLNEGAVALMSSIGHRTGLFDTLAQIPPATSAQIAEAAELDERYVREWLDGMVVSQVVTYDPDSEQYALPPEHAAFLTRSAAPDNMAMFAQYIPLLGTVEDKIVDCFYNGGGVPYSEFPRFVEVMAEDSGQTVVAALLDSILPLAPGLTERLQAGIDVLDVGCGSGRALNLMAGAFPNSRFTGYDFLETNIAAARAEAREKGLSNVSFEVLDVAEMPGREQYELITAFDAIHDQAHPARVLENIHRALKPGGVFLMQDIAGSSHVHHNVDLPLAPLLYTVSTMHCMTVSLAQDGEGLGTMWGKEKALEMLADAGFDDVDVHQLEHDFQNYYYVTGK
ncbi:MAG TPA: class I SAM-dependent methyltransferase [Candidatus Sulfomarinibacteraceae bacterium]|nr:class I SAM-dependent methyltransferase [Candidatus Sulfomarinibacteraceae bacterium]